MDVLRKSYPLEKKHTKAVIFFQSDTPMANVLSHTQVSCCKATVMNGDFSWGDGNNSPTSSKQLTRGSISHLGISGCCPMDRHPQPAAANLPFLLSFPHRGDADAATIIPTVADRLSSPQALLYSSQSWWWRAHLAPWIPETGKRLCQSLASEP